MGPNAEQRSDRTVRLAFRVYKTLLSPVLHAISPSRCLYLPTCSEYATSRSAGSGWFSGSWLALRRLARCHPWGKGGLDPVPERGSHPHDHTAQAGSSGCNQTKSDQTGADHLP